MAQYIGPHILHIDHLVEQLEATTITVCTKPGWSTPPPGAYTAKMRACPSPLLTTLALLTCVTATAQVSLRNVPEVARQRAERLRPLQVAALEPFWADLSLEYRGNQEVLDDTIQRAAELGDSVIPLLLEKLRPVQDGTTSRNLASNCRRVLQRLDPGSFVDVLAELARGTHGLARQEAIQLLGHATVPQSAVVLTSLIEAAEQWERHIIIQSLRRLKSPLAAKKVAPLLGSTDQSLREEVLSYLIAAQASSVIDTVIQAISVETHDRLLPSYIDYFAACAKGHEGVTEVLLPLLSRERIDWQDTRSLVKALATIAPKRHDATKRKLHELIEGNDTSSLAVQAAVTLRALGDKQGISRLKRALDDKIRRRKREAALYEQRASLQFAIGDYSGATSDYAKILDYSEGAAMTRRAYLGLLKGEARRNKIQNLVKYMKSSGMSPEEFVSLAEQDESFQAAMGHERIRTFLRQLAKERAPKQP